VCGTQATPPPREPFFPAAFRHAALVLVAGEDAGLAAEEVARRVIQVQTEHHYSVATVAAERKAAVAAALLAGEPAPKQAAPIALDDTAAPSVFTKLGYVVKLLTLHPPQRLALSARRQGLFLC
jgi:hypothetical protein